MFYKKYPPALKYKKWVECYYIWEGYSNTLINIESPPSALSSIVFNYKRPYSVSTTKYDHGEAPNAFICGQAIRNYTLHLSGAIGMVGVVFKPTGLYQLLGIPMYEFTGERLCVWDYVDNQYRDIINPLNFDSSHADKVQLLEKFISNLTSKTTYGNSSIEYAANEILAAFGNINLKELIKEIYMSRRQFERKFLIEVGISPKAYAKIRRFGHACHLLSTRNYSSISDVFFQTGYYDQSHFIRDFKYFTGRTPGMYLNNYGELAKYVRSCFATPT